MLTLRANERKLRPGSLVTAHHYDRCRSDSLSTASTGCTILPDSLRTVTASRSQYSNNGIRYFLETPRTSLSSDGPYALPVSVPWRRSETTDWSADVA